MKQGVLLLVSVMLSIASFAQKQLSDAEVQEFFRQIRQTREFKEMKAKTDSVNKKNEHAMPQQVEIHIVKKEGGTADDHIFTAALERMVMGAALEAYFIEYDNQKKQLVSIKKQQTRFQMN